jgi:L-threonylcarbamoyladenylate synthase
MGPSVNDGVRILRRGGLVAFPTETVYGLGVDATNGDAVRRIFAAKGRPDTNPLIVHVSDAQVAKRYAKHWPRAAEELARRFWPGPLTLVVFKSDAIVPEVSAGRDTVGLRAPDHPLALELLRAFDGPIAAPSANRSNRISPTTAGHVRMELGAAVDLILDGGPCRVGIESTVLDLTQGAPIILRPGAVTREQIEAVVGPVDVFAGNASASDPAASPGQQAVHYSPSTPAYRFVPSELERIIERVRARRDALVAVLLIAGSSGFSDLRLATTVRLMPADPAEYARELYATLRELDALGLDSIFIEMPPLEARWDAVRDRLTRATQPT